MRIPAEIKIARVMGVSQSSVREALQELEAQGLIVKYRNRSSHVIALDSNDLAYIHQVRRKLEPTACALAAPHMTRARLETIKEAIAAMKTAQESRDIAAFVQADLSFHRLIWRAQPNRYLEKCLQFLCVPLFAHDLIRRYGNAYLDFDRIIHQHQQLADALWTKDPEWVLQVTNQLLELWTRQDMNDMEEIQLLQEKQTLRTFGDPLMALQEMLASETAGVIEIEPADDP